ncbi:MAG: LamG domain-containing protein, partial [Nitrosotalea sp.]
ATSLNATSMNATSSNSAAYPVTIHNVTQSWQFDAPLQNLTVVGKTKIENDSNITSLKLVGTGYVVTKNNSTRNLSALTISAWVKPDYSQGSPIFTIVSKANQFTLSINNIIPPVHTVTFSIFDGIKWQTVNSTVLIGEKWTHLAATFNGTMIGIYVNGTLQSTLAITGVPTIAVNGTLTTKTVDQLSSNSDIVMGASLNSLRQVAANQFSGSIENVNLYDSQLSPSDITKMYYDNPLSSAFDISSLSPTSNLDANLTMSNNATTSLKIPLNNTLFLNNVTTVTNFTLIHAPIQINKQVIWTQNVTLSNQTNRVAVELPQDAQIIDINVANNTNSSTVYVTTNSTTYSSIIQPSTGLTNDIDIKTRHISKLEFVNDTNNTMNKMTYFAKMQRDAMTIASLNSIPGSVQSNKPTKLLVINDTAKRYNLRFETPAPYVVETNQSTSQLYHKTVIVEHNSTLHYTNVQSYSNIPENLVSKGVHFKLFWMINGSKIDVTNDSRFTVQFVDTNNNGIVDQMKWIVPRLSAQEFSIEGVIIPISNAQLLDSNRNFVEDVYPQVQTRDGNWTGDIPIGNYIRVTFGKNLTNINDITIFAKSNYSDASIEVYQKDSNQLLAHFGTISQDDKYKILLTGLNGSQNTFDLKIVGNPVNFDYIVDPSFTATPSDTLTISESAKMPQKTVTDTLTISEFAKMSQKTVTDTLPLSDKASPSRSAKDTFAISESAKMPQKTVTDTLTISESAKMPQKTVTDTLPLSDKASPSRSA